jgi:hypothetical protein
MKRRIRTEGAYIIKAAEGRPQRVPARMTPGYMPPQPTEADRTLARALLAHKRHPSQRSNDAPSTGANPALIRTQHTEDS